MKKLAVIVWWLPAIFASCSDPVEAGIVRDHRHTSQYTHRHDGGSTCISRDKNGLCSLSIDNPDYYHEHCVGGCWELNLADCNEEGECRTGWVYVLEETYHRALNGSHYDNDTGEVISG